ncbi:MAG: hypothetical protein QM820_03330 [Minicystis sp.]
MSTVRTAWHLYFALFVKEGAPPGFAVRLEVTLTTEPQRGDLLLLRRGERRDGEARTLRGLWPLLPSDTIVEFKSLSWPLRKGDLARLQGYGAQYFAAQVDERPFGLADLALVLVVPTRTPTLTDELTRMGWTMTEISRGYARVEGSGYAFHVVILAEVVDAEHDELLGLFSRRKDWTQAQFSWFWQHKTASMEGVSVERTEDFQQLGKEMYDYAMEHPELRAVVLRHTLLSLPDEALRALSDDYLRTLPVEVAEAVRARIGRPTS